MPLDLLEARAFGACSRAFAVPTEHPYFYFKGLESLISSASPSSERIGRRVDFRISLPRRSRTTVSKKIKWLNVKILAKRKKARKKKAK